MNTLHLIHRQTAPRFQRGRFEVNCFEQDTQDYKEEFPKQSLTQLEWDCARWPYKAGEFFKGLPEEAMREFQSLAAPLSTQEATVLFTEQQQPTNVYCLLEGRVKFSINSLDGKRLIVGIANPGEILGLNSVVSGERFGINAETLFPCVMARFNRQCFLDFLSHHAVAYRNVARQLSQELKRNREQSRMLGLTMTAPAKLALLLVEWCAEGQQTEHGIRIQCSLTHGEIGEHIGVSRETITRTLQDLRKRELVEQHGAALVVSNFRGLEIYAGAAC